MTGQSTTDISALESLLVALRQVIRENEMDPMQNIYILGPDGPHLTFNRSSWMAEPNTRPLCHTQVDIGAFDETDHAQRTEHFVEHPLYLAQRPVMRRGTYGTSQASRLTTTSRRQQQQFVGAAQR